MFFSLGILLPEPFVGCLDEDFGEFIQLWKIFCEPLMAQYRVTILWLDFQPWNCSFLITPYNRLLKVHIQVNTFE